MAFQIQIAGAEELSSRHLLTEVVISRPLYDHSRAELTLHWHEGSRYEDRQTAFLAGKLLNCPIDIQWKDNDLAEHFNGFRGYIEDVRGRRRVSSSSLLLSCVAFTRRTDLIPRYRTFQATTLLEIAQHIAQSDPLIKIDQAGDLDLPIVLSVQHGETNFAYLSRMLHAWGVPMALHDRTGQVILGARGTEAPIPFPDACYGWTEINFSGTLQALPFLASAGGGPAGVVAGREAAHNAELSRLAARYYSIPDAPAINKRVSEAVSRVDTSGYHLTLEGAVLPFSPGDVVTFEGQQHLIRDVLVTGHPQQTTATQEFRLQPLTLPLAPDRPRPQWTSRALWAHVTANEHDPLHQGRIQVEFEWEHMDPQPSAARAWLHTLTPYGGGAGGAKSTSYNGFYSIPEIGERVLVEFLGDWDSEAVVIGNIREATVPDDHNQHNTKRWRTPSGNEISHHTLAGTDNTRIRTRDAEMFMSQVAGGGTSVTLINASQPNNIVHMETMGGASRVYVTSGNIISVHSADEIHLTSKRIKMAASEDFQIFGKNIRIAAQEDMQQIAGKRAGLYSVQDMTVATQSNMHVGATGSVQVGAGAHLQLDGRTLQVESIADMHIDGANVFVNTGPVKNLPPTQQPDIAAPPAPPPAPTFATPHP